MAYGYDQGNPDEVLITGAEKISGWTQSSGNVYYKNLGYVTYQVFQNEDKLKFEPDGQNALEAGEWWLDKSSNRLYVYAKDKGSGFNPSNYNMEVSKRSGGFVLDNREYIHVKGFQICCFNPIIGDFIYEGVTYKIPRSPAVSISNAHNNVIEGNTIYNLVAYHSVPIIGGSYNRIENNKVFNVQGEAIKIWASRDDSLPSRYNIIKGNEVYNMDDYGGMETLFGGPKVLGWMYGNGISLGGDSGQYNEVSFNVVHDNNKGHGIWLDVGIQDTLIYSNIVFSNSRGIFVESRPKGTEVIKNIIYDNTLGIVVGGGPGLGPSYNGKFYNNVIYGNDRGMLILKARNNDFKNNLFFANVRGSVFVNTSDSSTEALKTALSGNTIDYNLYHSGDVSDIDNSDQFWWGKLQWVTENKNADKSFEEFKSASGQEKNSLNRHPQLVNPPTDFHLKSTSPAIDAGTVISLSLMNPPDYLGDAPDVGAFEFGLSKEGCLSDETSIGQDGCDAGWTCCCSGELPAKSSDFEFIIDSNGIESYNKLSLGAQISFTYTSKFPGEPAYHNLAKEAKLKMFRMMDSYIGYNYGPDGQRTNNGIYHPCRQWDDSSKTGTWDWQYADRLVESISNLDAETLIALGYRYSSGFQLPSGMQIDPSTGWPYPDSFGEYCRQWARHFKGDVKYYEIMNEAWFYFNEGGIFREDRAESFLELFDACYDAIKEEDPSALIGTDSSLQVKKFLDYWIDNDGRLDFLSFHKYDCYDILMEDEIPLQSAEQKYFETYSYWYGVDDARQKWADSHRGVILPVIISESNWGATSIGGTDPRIQKTVGAVRTALVLRKSILEGVDYHIYFDLTSSKSWEQSNKPSGGVGFGMINSDDKKPWYPYYVNKIIGENLEVGDIILKTTSPSKDVRTLAWINGDTLNILLINKVDEINRVRIDQVIQGLADQLSYYKIDNTYSWEDPQLQHGTIDVRDTITLDGYTVILLQKVIEPVKMRMVQWFRTSPFTTPQAQQSIEELKEVIPKCNYIGMDVFVDSIDEIATPRTTYENELGPAVQKAKQEGFKVVWRVQPKVGVKLGNRLNFDPPNPDPYFSNYADAVVYWAKKAEEYGVDDFVIGTELSKLEKYNNHWRNLIQNVKNVFTGKISYNTNFWYEDSDFNTKKSATWMQELDYIGVSAYWRMCSNEEAQRGVTVEELVNNWHSYAGWGDLQGEDIVKEHLEVLSETHGKPILIFTGLQSAEDACLTPWAWDRTTVDLNEQKNWYEAVFRVFSDEDWIYGFMFDGAWQTYANKRQNPNNYEFTIQGKPAEQTVAEWFAYS